MNPLVEQSITNFFSRISILAHLGKQLSSDEIKELQKKITIALPEWYVIMLSKYPLGETNAEYPDPEIDNNYFNEIIFANAQDIYNETELCYPGFAIRELGYICLARDRQGSDPYFIKITDDDNPTVYQVYHDVSDVAIEIEDNGIKKIADSLSDFFNMIRHIDYHNPFEEEE